jgi:photosystem II stability/assembly factor-like uncharacterized protein
MAQVIRAVILAAFFVLGAPAKAATYAWTPIEPSLAGIVSGGTDGSVLIGRRNGQDPVRSTDGGRTWSSFTVLGVRPDRFVASPTDARVFYALKGGAARNEASGGEPPSLYHSRDGGTTWEIVAERLVTPAGHALTDVAVGARPELLFAGKATVDFCMIGCYYVGGEAFVSGDGGRTWRSIDSGIDPRYPQSVTRQLYPSASHPQVLYATSYTSLFRSDDQGATWRLLRKITDWRDLPAHQFAVDRLDPNIAYLVFRYSSTELWVTEDGGQSWRLSDPGVVPGTYRHILPDPLERGRAYFLGDEGEVFESLDVGRQWTRLAPASGIRSLAYSTYANRDVAPVVAATVADRRFAGFGLNGAAARLAMGPSAFFVGSDHWWNPAESGTGLSISQHPSGQIVAGWYVYDGEGRATWRFMSGGTWLDDRTFVGDFHEMSGPPFLQGPFDPSRVGAAKVGTGTFHFEDDDNATFSYRLTSGEEDQKRITRYLFAAPTFILGGGYQNYPHSADTWWNEAESGWGLTISQQYGKIFAIWYLYDERGRPTWFVMPDMNWSEYSDGQHYGARYRGQVYATTGPPAGVPFDPARVRLNPIGSVFITFPDRSSARIEWEVLGRTGSRTLTRLPY